MRKWHRWLSILFGIFILWIAGTGLASHVVPIWQNGGFGDAPRTAAATAAGFVCPESMTCRPKPPGGRSIVGTLHHLHSGESFGAAGQIVAILSGLALVFFAISGLWLYVQMLRGRLVRARAGRPQRGGKLFW